MKVHNLSEKVSVMHQFIAEVRDKHLQRDRLRFRRNMERIGEIMAFEISKELSYKEVLTQTVLGEAESKVIEVQPVIATILRAGLPFHSGFLNMFDKAGNAFVSAYRRHHKNNMFDVHIDYISCPTLEDKVLIIADPMLATGTSMQLACQALMAKGKPQHIHFASVIGSREGVDHIRKHFPGEDITLWLGAMDEELTAQAFIVPGLGDAGDLSYGEKL